MKQREFVFCKLSSYEATSHSPAVRIYLRKLLRTLDGQALGKRYTRAWAIALSWAIANEKLIVLNREVQVASFRQGFDIDFEEYR
jgi:hypothetical protein